FEHERREEVIQSIYQRYGRHRAAIAGTVIRYRARSAIREVGKALGLSEDVTARLAKASWGPGRDQTLPELAAGLGLDPVDTRLGWTLRLAEEIQDFPRHLATHVGGFVISRGPLTEMAVIGNAAMEGRTVLEWDKDDIDALGLLKVDILALGMLSMLRRGFQLLKRHHRKDLDLAGVPRDCPETYAMLRRADSVGVFQVESRAQMNMLPRLRPSRFYDLVIQVAIIRPGPIQGDMVHPYLRRRWGLEQPVYPSPGREHGHKDELKDVLKRTLGVPLFQEQAMRVAMVAAKFTPEEADKLRRAMATFKHTQGVSEVRERLVGGMVRRGYDPELAERVFQQLEGFGSYGFPESHAASFAHLAYASSWLKRWHPSVFAAALLNAQPMGFYAPAQIVRDAREHGVAVRPVDVNQSGWDCTLEPEADSAEGLALRLGLRQAAGLAQAEAERLVKAREAGNRSPFASVEEVVRRAELSR
ncbi:helix-hairpin-helix domain-containing protein, partial [Teichococcus vastitatis]